MANEICGRLTAEDLERLAGALGTIEGQLRMALRGFPNYYPEPEQQLRYLRVLEEILQSTMQAVYDARVGALRAEPGAEPITPGPEEAREQIKDRSWLAKVGLGRPRPKPVPCGPDAGPRPEQPGPRP